MLSGNAACFQQDSAEMLDTVFSMVAVHAEYPLPHSLYLHVRVIFVSGFMAIVCRTVCVEECESGSLLTLLERGTYTFTYLHICCGKTTCGQLSLTKTGFYFQINTSEGTCSDNFFAFSFLFLELVSIVVISRIDYNLNTDCTMCSLAVSRV